jgi:hypothetical protein
MIKEDNNGFINLPIQDTLYEIVSNKKTLIYIVVFHPDDLSNRYILSNIKMDTQDLNLVGDDVNGYLCDNTYFNKGDISIPLSSAICIGWSEKSFLNKNSKMPWVANFRNLSHEGKKLFYSMKKLHNQKEIRILTFSDF